MAEKPAQERTEQPTARRLAKAREEGQIPRSQELLAVTVLLSGTLALSLAGGGLGRGVGAGLESLRWRLAAGPMTDLDAAALLRGLVLSTLGVLAPILGAILLPVLLVGGLQARGVLSWKPVTPQWSRINPGQGLKRLLGLEGVFSLLKAVAKLGVLVTISWTVLRSAWPDLAALSDASAPLVLAVVRVTALRIALLSGAGFLGLSLVDFLFMSWRHRRQLRMSRQELVEEHRETEGDPLRKSRIRSLALQLARKRMLQRVKEADVVVVNPTHIAVALRYDPATASAPLVLAMGQRKLAERIRALATAARVPIVENMTVARALLASAKVGQPIPPALYVAIAEILAFVYRRHGRGPALLAGAKAR